MRSRLVFFIAFSLALCAHAEQDTAGADWRQFRAAYPYHIQTVALSNVHPDGHRTMIVSEPPPSLTLNDIRGLSTDFSGVMTGTHGIGVDGWVKDVIIDLPPLRDTTLVADMDRLHR